MAARLIIPCFLTLLVGAAPAAAQPRPGTAEQPDAAESFLPVPSVELGESFQSDEWGFEFRLPQGMEPLSPEGLKQLNERLSVPEELRTAEDGTVGKLHHYQFLVPGGSANILLQILEPPRRIDSPSALRKDLNDRDQKLGRPVRSYGRLHRFRALDGRGGFFATREFGLNNQTGFDFRQSCAYLLGATRSYIILYTAKIDEFEQREQDFQACLASFKISDGVAVTATRYRPARKTAGYLSAPVIGNLVLAAALLLLLVRVVRGGKVAPDS